LRANDVDIAIAGAFTRRYSPENLPSAVAIWIRLWNRCAFIPGFGARPPHDGDAGRDNPDAWVPATQLKGHK